MEPKPHPCQEPHVSIQLKTSLVPTSVNVDPEPRRFFKSVLHIHSSRFTERKRETAPQHHPIRAALGCKVAASLAGGTIMICSCFEQFSSWPRPVKSTVPCNSESCSGLQIREQRYQHRMPGAECNERGRAVKFRATGQSLLRGKSWELPGGIRDVGRG